jgi:gluconokinase|tara:strand:- start:2735 stop:3217 length:483 start_codon:yes stop_codon:yes gene_type:complete
VKPPNRIVLMGVSGAGKTTVGRLLAAKLSGLFVDGDDLHPQANVDKMKHGIALTDDDRWPWLDRVAQVIREHDGTRPLIVACSTLKRSYRRRLGKDYYLIYLKGTSSEIARRLQDRDDHFMPISLLESQFEALEEPDNALVLDLDQSPHEIAEKIILALS